MTDPKIDPDHSSDSPSSSSSNGWAEYKRWILAEIKRMDERQTALQEAIVSEVKELRKDFNSKISSMEKTVNDMRDCQTMLKVKMGIISGLSGMGAGAIIGALVSLLMK